jgi:alcohol dehydrogenase (NADP+)
MRDDDVVIEIKYAGICHSDIHQVREEWGKATFPMVPGHEIGGVVVAVGANVKDMAIGEHAGVGCFVDSCRNCRNCRQGQEQYCSNGYVGTYNSKYKYCIECGNNTYGGYSKHIVVDRAFALKIPQTLDLAAATPLLCAGITVYSPMMHFGLTPNMKFGVVGLGGLGHMAAKFGVAFGCHTTVISRGMAKRENALNELKTHDYIDSTDAEQMGAGKGTFDFIVCTVSAQYDIRHYLQLLRTNGKFIVVGAPPCNVDLSCSQLIFSRTQVAGSLVGGLPETQEMLDFCGRHNITCDIELVGAKDIERSYDRTVASDVKYRFVIDTSTI